MRIFAIERRKTIMSERINDGEYCHPAPYEVLILFIWLMIKEC
jgi:hypothetical protein